MKLNEESKVLYQTLTIQMKDLIPELRAILKEEGRDFDIAIQEKKVEIIKVLEKEGDNAPFLIGNNLAKRYGGIDTKNGMKIQNMLYVFAGIQLQEMREKDNNILPEVKSMIDNPGVYVVGSTNDTGVSILYSNSGKLTVMKFDRDLDLTKFSKDMIVKGVISL